MTIKRQNGSMELLFFLALFLILILVTVIWFLMPQVRHYLHHCEIFEKQTVQLNDTQQSYDRLFETHRREAKQGNGYETMFTTASDPDALQVWGGKTLDAFTVTPVVTVSGAWQEYNATARLQSPNAFQTFVRTFPKAPWVLQLRRPITFEMTPDGLEVRFGIRTLVRQ